LVEREPSVNEGDMAALRIEAEAEADACWASVADDAEEDMAADAASRGLGAKVWMVGRTMVKVAPLPLPSLSADRAPLCISMSDREMARPRPPKWRVMEELPC
jgi:hypothetical protein